MYQTCIHHRHFTHVALTERSQTANLSIAAGFLGRNHQVLHRLNNRFRLIKERHLQLGAHRL